jgi:hypothetical protein
MSECIIAQLQAAGIPMDAARGAFSWRLQLHDYGMTSSADPPKKLNSAGRYRSWMLALAVSVAAALLIIAPFFWLGIASGHDFEFHAASWLDAAGQWKEGIVYPRWTGWANHGFGEPRFIFYPPLSWMLGAALGFVVPWIAVPGVFIAIVQTIAGLCAFGLAQRWLPERGALLGAAFYAANPYALLVIYLRSDFAEQLAATFLPLLVLAALQLGGIIENRCNSLEAAIVLFAVVFAVIWLSNAPAGVLASYSAALLIAWGAWTERSWRPLMRGAAGLTLGLGIAGFYLLPAAYEQKWVNIGQALSSGLLPSQNFLYTVINDPEHNQFNWIASSAAILLMVTTGIATVVAHGGTPYRGPNEEQNKLWRALLLLAASATALMFSFTSIFWTFLPELRFVQFPWRWMSVLAVPCAYFLAVAAARRRFGWTWGLAVLAVVVGVAAFLVRRAWWDTEDIPVLQAAIREGRGFEGTDEYDPVGDDHYNLPAKSPLVNVLPALASEGGPPEATVLVEGWTAEEKEVRVTAKKPVRVALRLLNYPAWRVEVNGLRVRGERAEESNQIIVPVKEGESRVTVRFTHTTDRALGGLLSIVCLCLALAMVWRSKR